MKYLDLTLKKVFEQLSMSRFVTFLSFIKKGISLTLLVPRAGHVFVKSMFLFCEFNICLPVSVPLVNFI